MAYNKKTMKFIDGMMPPTTKDKASFSTKKTNEQANISAEQRNVVETRAYRYKEAMKNKGISYADYHYIVKATGSTTAAENAVINAPASILKSMIKAEKDKENKPKLPTTTPATTTKTKTIKPTTSYSPTVEDVDDEVDAESFSIRYLRDRQKDIDNNYNGDQGAYWIEKFNQQTANLVNTRLETEMKNKGIDENEYKALQSYYMSIVKAKDAVLNMSKLKLEKILDEIAKASAPYSPVDVSSSTNNYFVNTNLNGLQSTMDEVSSFINNTGGKVSNLFNGIGSWITDKKYEAVEDFTNSGLYEFFDHNISQLDYKTDTLEVVKEIYRVYNDNGIDVNQLPTLADLEKEYGATELNKLINNSTILEEEAIPNGLYATLTDANIAYLNEGNPITIRDDRETGAILVPVPVTIEEADGTKHTVKMYTRDDTFEGMTNNIVSGTALRIAAYTLDTSNPIKVSVSHTHPSNGPKYITQFSSGFGDEIVARLPMVDYMFVSDVDHGDLQVYNEALPNTFFKSKEEIAAMKEVLKKAGVSYQEEVLPYGSLPKVP